MIEGTSGRSSRSASTLEDEAARLEQALYVRGALRRAAKMRPGGICALVLILQGAGLAWADAGFGVGVGGLVGLTENSVGGVSLRPALEGQEGALGFDAGPTVSFPLDRGCSQSCGHRPLGGSSFAVYFGVRYHFLGGGSWSPYVRAAPELTIMLPAGGDPHGGPGVRLGGGVRYALSSAVQLGVDANTRLGGSVDASGDFGAHAAVELLPSVVVWPEAWRNRVPASVASAP